MYSALYMYCIYNVRAHVLVGFSALANERVTVRWSILKLSFDDSAGDLLVDWEREAHVHLGDVVIPYEDETLIELRIDSLEVGEGWRGPQQLLVERSSSGRLKCTNENAIA